MTYDITRHFSKLTGGDPAINATTSIRLPGSINTKANRGNVVTILEQNANRYDPTELAPPPPIRSPPAGRSNSQVNPELIAAVLTILYRDWDAAPRQSGSRWHAARCPFGHKRDRRGEHFYFDEAAGAANCFGRHGGITLMQLCAVLNIRAKDYGGLWVRS